MHNWPNPFIEQRADPYILRHEGQYYFIASVPQYDRLAIRRAASLEGLRSADEVVVWRKPQTGPMSQLIWAPELLHIDGKWYIYFAAAHTQALDGLGMFQHRMFVLECADRDPLTGTWTEKGQVKTPFDTFALDATTFVHQGKRWYLWAQKAPDISGNSNLYLCEMENPWTLKGEPVMLSKPEYDGASGSTQARRCCSTATSCLSAIPPARPTRTTAWGCCGQRSMPIRKILPTGTRPRARSSSPATKTASMGQAITALRRRRKAKMCWSTTRETTLKLKAIRFTIPIAILA